MLFCFLTSCLAGLTSLWCRLFLPVSGGLRAGRRLFGRQRCKLSRIPEGETLRIVSDSESLEDLYDAICGEECIGGTDIYSAAAAYFGV